MKIGAGRQSAAVVISILTLSVLGNVDIIEPSSILGRGTLRIRFVPYLVAVGQAEVPL
jgi:hypothetical protein